MKRSLIGYTRNLSDTSVGYTKTNLIYKGKYGIKKKVRQESMVYTKS